MSVNTKRLKISTEKQLLDKDNENVELESFFCLSVRTLCLQESITEYGGIAISKNVFVRWSECDSRLRDFLNERTKESSVGCFTLDLSDDDRGIVSEDDTLMFKVINTFEPSLLSNVDDNVVSSIPKFPCKLVGLGYARILF